MRDLRTDGDRLWSSLMEMGRIGATAKGGVNRQALTDGDRQARDLFQRWCREAGCELRTDGVGNMFARRAGRQAAAAPVLAGSHLDTQPSGGRFDGAYGVLAALEAVRTLADAGIETARPIEIVAWTNEEGCRFAPAMAGSGVFAGLLDGDQVLAATDRAGASFGAELDRIGWRGTEPVGGREVAAYFEAHIEQGPILEMTANRIGVVTGAQALRWFDVALTGTESHAGTTPMIDRRDALAGAARLVEAVNRIGFAHEPDGRATVGEMHVAPNSRNTIPGRVLLTVDLRHPDEAALAAMVGELEVAAHDVAGEAALELALEPVARVPAVAFDAGCIAAVAAAAEACGYDRMEMISGAGHDACNMARVAPTAMIFIPCEGGISHNEAESATPADCAAGADVLLQAVVTMAERA